MAVAGCINAYDCAGCYLTTLQQLQSDNIGVAINYTAPGEYGRRELDYIKYTDKCGCTCCLIGENELKIYATQGVIKNLTLTNDDTNEVVIVKWTDLFGSNRAKTVVRYKTGSYPSSPTDGTLAVEETTQNQYQTNGYSVSGLTDGITYYFSVFALDGNNTTINVQSMSITPDFGWKPSSNTLLYYPLTSNLVDVMGNGSTGTMHGTCKFSSSTGIHVTGQNGNYVTGLSLGANNRNTYTLNVWSKFESGQTLWGNSSNVPTGQAVKEEWTGKGTGSDNINVHVGNGSNGMTNPTPTIRHNICISANNGTYKMYLNGVLIVTGSRTGTTNNYGTMNIGYDNYYSDRKSSGYLKDYIVETIAWSDEDILKYYNKTKSNFGL